MTCFWRPVPGLLGHPMNKVEQAGLREMWCRCDLCLWSGPLEKFMLGARRGDTIEICCDCQRDANLIRMMLREGWVFQ